MIKLKIIWNTKNINMQYIYTKQRLEFGKQCNFSNYQKIEVDIKPHAGYMNHYIQINPTTRATQCSNIYSVHEVHAHKFIFKNIYVYEYYYYY